jgi:hypothetical protein
VDSAAKVKSWLQTHGDAVVAAFLMLTAMGLSACHVIFYAGPISPKNQPDPGIFDAAVMIASGNGFSAPITLRPLPALEQFMACETDSLRPEEMPQGLICTEPAQWDRCHRYLISLIGLTWRLFGISWYVLWIPAALLYGITGAAVYGLFRLVMGRMPAVLGTLITLTSPLMIEMSASMRDFSKAPFFLLALLIVGYLIKKPVRFAVFLALSGSLGIVLGFGLGFRQDLNICIPTGIAAIALCWHGVPRRHNLAGKGLALALFLVCFLVPAWPVLVTVMTENGAESAHDVMMGLPMYESVDAGCKRPSYDLIYLNDDNLVHAPASLGRPHPF